MCIYIYIYISTIIQILGFKQGELYMTYLGIPLISSRLKVVYRKGLWTESGANLVISHATHTQRHKFLESQVNQV